MVASDGSCSRVEGEFCSREEVLPSEFPWGIGIFSFECMGEGSTAASFVDVLIPEMFHKGNLFFDGAEERAGEDSIAVFFAFSFADDNFPVLEVDIFDSEPDAFAESESAAVENCRHKLVWRMELIEDGLDFMSAEEDGDACVAFGPGDESDGAEFHFEDMAIEEEEGIESLVLG